MDRGGEGEGRVPVCGLRIRRDRVPVAARVSDVSRHRVGTGSVEAVHTGRLTDERLTPSCGGRRPESRPPPPAGRAPSSSGGAEGAGPPLQPPPAPLPPPL